MTLPVHLIMDQFPYRAKYLPVLQLYLQSSLSCCLIRPIDPCTFSLVVTESGTNTLRSNLLDR